VEDADLTGLQNISTPIQAWPGRMSTARDLLQKRAAAKRRRETSDSASVGARLAGGGLSDASSSEADEVVSSLVDESVKAESAREGTSKLARSASGQREHRALIVCKDQRPHWMQRYSVPKLAWQPAATQLSDNPFVTATPLTHPHLQPRRRAHSTISGDGFALVEEVFFVPPLTVLCVKCMQQDLPRLGAECVGLLPPALRHSLVYSTAASRRLDSSTCQVFAPLRASMGHAACDEEGGAPVSVEDILELPDCSCIDDATLRETLALCAGHLHSLHLRHCGRCFTDRTVRWLTSTVPGSLAELHASPPGRVFASLRRIHLEGAYALSNDGLRALLNAAAPALLTLALHAAPDIDGGVLRNVASLAPGLQSLTVSACHKVGDVALGVKYAILGGGAGAKRPRDEAAGALHFKATDDEVSPSDAMLLPYEATTLSQAAFPPGHSLSHAAQCVGLMMASHLRHLELSHLPNVTDALFDSLLSAGNGHTALSSLGLRQMPGITNHTMHLLGGRSSPRSGILSSVPPLVAPLPSDLPPASAHLTVLVLDTLPNVGDTGLRSIARCLKGDTVRLGVINMHSVKKEPSILRLLKGATQPAEERSQDEIGATTQSAAAPSGVNFGFSAPDFSPAGDTEGGSCDGGAGLARIQLSGVTCMTDASLALLASSSAVLSLRHVELSWCRGVTDTGVGMLADSCSRLLTLRVWGNTQLTSQLFSRLSLTKHGASGGEVSTLYIEGRPGDKLPPPEYELPARAGGAASHLFEVSALP
jgi:hypothetical protein